MVRDYCAWQRSGQRELAAIPSGYGELLNDHLGSNVGAYGVFGSTFYDIARASDRVSQARRAEVARQGILLAGSLEIIDDTIDAAADVSANNLPAVAQFLDNCRDALLTDCQPEVVPVIASAERQMACYGIARHAGEVLEANRPERRDALAAILADLKKPVMAQFTQFKAPELLETTRALTGYCTEAVALVSEFVDEQAYPEMRQAAWHFGALSGVLDHGSEILADLKEGSNTFATAHIREHGASSRVLKDIADMRQGAARESYEAGLSYLSDDRQRTIYRTAARLVTGRYAVRRAQEAVTPVKIERVLYPSRTSFAYSGEVGIWQSR